MKTITNIFCAAVLMSTLSAGFTACNKPQEQQAGLGKDIPGIETLELTGTVIGDFSDHGYASLILQVDEEFPIGESVDYVKIPVNYLYLRLPETGIYNNLIQVQHTLPVKIGERMAFSAREFRMDKDNELFILGSGITTMEHTRPSCPAYVITKYTVSTK